MKGLAAKLASPIAHLREARDAQAFADLQAEVKKGRGAVTVESALKGIFPMLLLHTLATVSRSGKRFDVAAERAALANLLISKGITSTVPAAETLAAQMHRYMVGGGGLPSASVKSLADTLMGPVHTQEAAKTLLRSAKAIPGPVAAKPGKLLLEDLQTAHTTALPEYLVYGAIGAGVGNASHSARKREYDTILRKHEETQE